MLAVQEYLRGGKSLDDLGKELGINVYKHPTLPMVGLKYNQIDSPKTHEVVRDCRGIVLEQDTWNILAKPFRRFYNAGEVLEEYRQFDWNDFSCTEKVDGSLILVYFYEGQWHVNTSGSFGFGECGFSGMNWQELFWKTSKLDKDKLNKSFTYIFELCTIFNKVVRSYPEPVVYLLSIFHVDEDDFEELTLEYVDCCAENLGIARPEHYEFHSEKEIRDFLLTKEEYDKTFEGVIVRDENGLRFKIKSETYVALHHLKDNGNICNPKRLVPLVLAGESDEVLAYLPEVEEPLRQCQTLVEAHWTSLLACWKENWQIENQKDFALAIRNKMPFTGLLFNLRKQHGDKQTEDLLRDSWRNHSDGITKVLYG